MTANKDRQLWHDYYSEKRIVHQWFQVDLLKSLDVRKILEVGPHFGLVSAMMANAGYEVTTLDITAEPPEPGVARHIQSDIREISPELMAGHDVIICCETLEHIPWKDVKSVLCRFAESKVHWLIISVPYSAFQFGFSLYFNRHIFRKRSFLKSFRFLTEFSKPQSDRWDEHKWEIGYKGYSVQRLRDLVAAAGYQIQHQDFTSGCRSIFLMCQNQSVGNRESSRSEPNMSD